MPKRLSNQFNHRITFLQDDGHEDELGQWIEVWQEVKRAWAAIKTMQGREYFAAAAAQAENTCRFVIRYAPDITTDMRINYKGRIFDISQPPINDDEANKTLTIIAKERV